MPRLTADQKEAIMAARVVEKDAGSNLYLVTVGGKRAHMVTSLSLAGAEYDCRNRFGDRLESVEVAK